MPSLLDGRLKLKHLTLVDALTTAGSMVGAASALHVTQPVVTRALQDLEEILGVPLYERGPQGVTPTQFGVAFTDHARAVIAQLNQAARHVDEIADARRGQVTVGTHLAGSNLLLPRAIVELKRAHPLLSVLVRERSPEALAVELTSGRVDMIVGRLTRASSALLRHQVLYEERVRLVVGRGHPLLSRTSLQLADTVDYPWILPGSETDLRAELERLFTGKGLDLPANRVEATSFLTVRQLLIETEMIAAMPSLIGANDPRLALLPVTLEAIGHHVGLTVARGRRLSPAARAMIDALAQAAATIGS